MTTMSEMVNNVLIRLEGYTQDQNVYTTITNVSGISATASSFTTGKAVSPGLVEIGDELIYVGSVNTTASSCTDLIRGFRGTPALAHEFGAVVIDTPRILRTQVKNAINDTILDAGRRIGVMRSWTFTATHEATYDVPSDCVDVRKVSLAVPGTDSWRVSRSWRYDRTAGSPSVSGSTVTLGEAIPGFSVRIDYIAYANEILSGIVDGSEVDDDFTDSGLPDWTREVVELGAIARLVTFLDAAGITVRSGDQHALNAQSPWGSAMSLSKYLNALYEARVEEAAKRQRREYDFVTHWQG